MNCAVFNKIVRVEGNKHFSIEDTQIKECDVSLILDGVPLTRAVITVPDNMAKELWALGYLKSNGIIKSFEDVDGLDINQDSIEVR
ncbi:MAG: formate dehydrogenase accessory sulfurtransferase FdhD, partial [Oscillospiraceae bacterium]|nr:formate dehydrogenase accessory sulfurtransferase FdhD [Oscillospiraceae bacterium]